MSLDSKFYSQGWSHPDSLSSELLGGFPNPRLTVLGEGTARVLRRYTQDVKKASCGQHGDETKVATTSPVSGSTVQ